MQMEELLDMLGSETRREILQMLSERPRYVSQLSHDLKIGQKAVIEHLELMREAGILEPSFRKIQKGRPRKYYGIVKEVILEVSISHDSFTLVTVSPKINKEILNKLPRLKEITERLEDVLNAGDEEETIELRKIAEELEAEQADLNEARKIIMHLLNEINRRMKEEGLTVK